MLWSVLFALCCVVCARKRISLPLSLFEVERGRVDEQRARFGVASTRHKPDVTHSPDLDYAGTSH